MWYSASIVLLLASLVQAFQPAGFRSWYLQSSVVVDDWLYIAGGNVVTGSASLQFLNYTYSINLSQSWTTSNVTPIANQNPSFLVAVKEPMLWFDPVDKNLHMWAGLPFNTSNSPGCYFLAIQDSGQGTWAQSTVPSDDSGSLRALWSAAYTASPKAFYSVSGADTTGGDVTPVNGMVINDFQQNTWVNESSAGGFDELFTFDASIHFASQFGSAGLLVALGGGVIPDQLSYNDGAFPLAGFAQISIYDVGNDTWYKQTATGQIPPPVSDYCSAGVESGDGLSYEIYLFGGATNDSYDTTNDDDTALKDIYILSLPAFHWVQVGQPSEVRRRAMSCQVIGQSQLLVIGGSFFANENRMKVDPWPNGMAVFDLAALAWTSGLFNHTASPYQRPSSFQDVYKQNFSAKFDNTALAALFPTNEASAAAGGKSSSPTSLPLEQNSRKKGTNVGAIIGGTLAGVAVVVIGLCIYIFRHKIRFGRAIQTQTPVNLDPVPRHELDGKTHELCKDSHISSFEMDAKDPQKFHEMEAPTTMSELDSGKPTVHNFTQTQQTN